MIEFDSLKLAESILEQINIARTDPQVYIDLVQEERYEAFDEDNTYMSNGIKYKATEGKKACAELIQHLSVLKSTPLKTLTRSEGLDKAALDLANHNGETGGLTHLGKNGSTMEDRVSEYGKWVGIIAECIGVQAVTGQDFVINWLIDDGIEQRGDMKAILNGGFTHIGIGTAKHRIHGLIAVIVLAKSFWEKDRYGNLPEEAEKADNTNPDLMGKMPEELRELPEDAVGVDIERTYKEEGGSGRTVYNLVYRLKDGTRREEIKEYEGEA